MKQIQFSLKFTSVNINKISHCHRLKVKLTKHIKKDLNFCALFRQMQIRFISNYLISIRVITILSKCFCVTERFINLVLSCLYANMMISILIQEENIWKFQHGFVCKTLTLKCKLLNSKANRLLKEATFFIQYEIYLNILIYRWKKNKIVKLKNMFHYLYYSCFTY